MLVKQKKVLPTGKIKLVAPAKTKSPLKPKFERALISKFLELLDRAPF